MAFNDFDMKRIEKAVYQDILVLVLPTAIAAWKPSEQEYH